MKNADVLSLDGKLLKTFLAVYETNSVTQAAEVLGVSQSSVSHSLNRLRDCIGDPLFTKRGRGIAPTHTSVSIAPGVSRILSQIEGLAPQEDYDPVSDDGPFAIATNVTELLPALLAAKKQVEAKACRAKLRFVELGERKNALRYLEESKADLAISASIGSYPLELSVKRLYQDSLVCFFDPTQRSAPKSVNEYCSGRHAVLDFGGTNKSIVDSALENAGLSRSIGLAASNSYALARFANGTDLIATLPRGLASGAFRGFEYCFAPFALPAVSYDLVWHRRLEKSARHVWFRDTITEAVAASPDFA